MKQVCIQRARKSVCDRPDLLDLHDVVVKLMNRIRLNPNSTPRRLSPANLSSLICPSKRARGVQFWVQSDRRSQTTSVNLKRLAPRAGLEPATLRLTVVARKRHHSRLKTMMIRALSDLPSANSSPSKSVTFHGTS